METPFQKAEPTNKRFKGLFYGDSGTGKTTLALKFPNPVVIDMEHGTDHYADMFDFSVVHTASPNEVMKYIDWLASNQHDFKTLIIDPLTVYYVALQNKYADIFMIREKKSAGYKIDYYQIQPQDWRIIKPELKKLLRKCMQLDMNLICTAHEKPVYAEGQMMKSTGEKTFDCDQSIKYVFDTRIRTYRTKDNQFKGVIDNDRTGKLTVGSTIDLDYSIFKNSFGDNLTKSVIPKEYITEEQTDVLKNYWLKNFKLDAAQEKRLLTRFDVEELSGLTKEQASKFIEQFKQAYAKKQGMEG